MSTDAFRGWALVIDANILLDLYDARGDAISELITITKLGIDKYFKIYTTNFIKYEFNKNRENKLQTCKKNFAEVESKLQVNIPNMYKSDSTLYTSFTRNLEKAKKDLKNLGEKFEEDLNNNNINIDKVVLDYFQNCEEITFDENIYTEALKRHHLSMCPGKGDTLGDQINWLILLHKIPSNKSLVLVSKDSDYGSSLDKSKIKSVLSQEFSKLHNNQKIVLADSLKKITVHQLKLYEEVSRPKRKELIRTLKESGSYSETHIIIKDLVSFLVFSDADILELLKIAQENSQVGGIIKDNDVESFYASLAINKSHDLSTDTKKQLKKWLKENNIDIELIKILGSIENRQP